jgi:arylsulfatase A-like enzyme
MDVPTPNRPLPHVDLSRRSFVAATMAAAAAGTLGAASCAGSRQATGANAAPMFDAGRIKPAAPNILFIISDDHRYDYLSCRGHPAIRTPHMDRIAREGAICENAFVTTSLCSPSRASILTGLYAHLHGVLDNGTMVPPELPSYPVLMQRAGYDTAYVGKWHMGAYTDVARPGWSHWASFVGQGNYSRQSFNINGTRITTDESEHTTDAITRLSVEWLSSRNGSKPFCMCVGHKAPHDPFGYPTRFAGMYGDAQMPTPMADTPEHYRTLPHWVQAQRNSWHGVDGMYDGRIDFRTFWHDYLRSITAVDDGIGTLLAALEQLGQLDNTLVVYIGDNGFQAGEHGLIDKRVAYEASIRIPMLCMWRGRIPAGSRVQDQILNIDLPSLFLDAAGLRQLPTFQGTSFLPILSDPSTRTERLSHRDGWLYEYYFERDFPQTPTIFAVRTPKWKYIESYGVWDGGELYDLENDPAEMNNLAFGSTASRPGGEHAEKVREMRALMDRLIYESAARRDPLWADRGMTPAFLGHCETPPWPRGEPPRPKGA